MNKKIYIAGPLFSEHERRFLETLTEYVAGFIGLDPLDDFFLPHRDAGDVGVSGTRFEVFAVDLRQLDVAEMVIALLDGVDVDSGTAVELGYAYAKGKKIFGILTDRRAYIPGHQGVARINNMIWGVCENGDTVYSDAETLSSAVSEFLRSQGG